MPMKSSSNLGTEQENKTELSMSSDPQARLNAEAAAKELVAERLPDEVEASVEATADAVVEAAATVTTEELATFAELLADGRELIDAIDDQILELIARRIETAGTLLTAKHTNGVNPRDKARQAAIYARLFEQAAEFADNGVHISKHQVREIFELLIRLGVENHRKNIIDRR